MCTPRHAPPLSKDSTFEAYEDDYTKQYYKENTRECEDLDFNVGLLFVPEYSGTSLILFSKLQESVIKSTDGDILLQKKAFKAMQSSSDTSLFMNYDIDYLINGDNSVFTEYWNTTVGDGCPSSYQQALKDGFDEICSSESWALGCSMMTFNIQRKKNAVSAYIPGIIANKEYLSLQNVSYANTLYQETPLNAMIANPPVSLVENFLNCHLGPKNAIINAAGVSFSNANVLVGGAIFLFLFFLRKYWNNVVTKRRRAKQLIAQEIKDDLYRKVVIVMFQTLRDGNGATAQFSELVKGLKAFDMSHDEVLSIDSVLEELREKNLLTEEEEPPELPDELRVDREFFPEARMPNTTSINDVSVSTAEAHVV